MRTALGSWFSDSRCQAADQLKSRERAFHVCQDLWRAELPLVILRFAPLPFCSPRGVLQDPRDLPQAWDVQGTSVVHNLPPLLERPFPVLEANLSGPPMCQREGESPASWGSWSIGPDTVAG